MKKFIDQLSGQFKMEHVRDGKVIDTIKWSNLITDQGKIHALDVLFHGAPANATWYMGLIGAVGFTAIAAGDTYQGAGTTNGWSEFEGYTDAANSDSATTRPEWVEDAAASNQITNTAVVTFDITSAGTVRGGFIAGGDDAQVKGDTSGGNNVLWNASLLAGGDRVVAVNDQLKITFTVSA